MVERNPVAGRPDRPTRVGGGAVLTTSPGPPPPPDVLGPVLRALILAAAFTGLRQSELML